MITGYVAEQIKRLNKNLLITNIVILAICLAIPLMCINYIRECIAGPAVVKVADIAQLNSASDAPRKFVRVEIDQDDLDTNTYHIDGGSAKQHDRFFFLHAGGGKFLIILAHDTTIPSTLEGELTELSSDVKDSVLPETAGHVEGERLNVMLDTSSYRTNLWLLIFFDGPFLLLAVWNILKAVIRMGNPLAHPAAKQLAKMGPPEEIAIAVDAEVRAGTHEMGRVITTQSWLIQASMLTLTILYLGDVAWIYKKETKHKSHGVTTRVTYETVIFDVRGKQHSFQLKQDQVDALLRELATLVPWAFVGFTKEMEVAWKKNRKDVLAKVEERKQKVMAQASGGAA